jgi:ATP-dependent Zn protease
MNQKLLIRLFITIGVIANFSYKYCNYNSNQISLTDITQMVNNGTIKSIVLKEDKNIGYFTTENNMFNTVIPIGSFGNELLSLNPNVNISYMKTYDIYEMLYDMLCWIFIFNIMLSGILLIIYLIKFTTNPFIKITNDTENNNNGNNHDNNENQPFSMESIITGNNNNSDVFEIFRPGSNIINFNDVIGLEPIKDILNQFTKFIKYRELYLKNGCKLPKGILFVGSPGTGKTLLAKAFAHNCNASFISTCGANFDGILVGLGTKKIKQLFNTARKNSPCVIFIDEFDAIGKRENKNNIHSGDRQTITTFLSELDGMKPNENIMIIGATNDMKNLDPAILRSGRFDRKLIFDLPNLDERKKLFDLYLKKIKLSGIYISNYDDNLDKLAKLTARLSGADIANIVNQAMLNKIKDLDENSCRYYEKQLSNMGEIKPINIKSLNKGKQPIANLQNIISDLLIDEENINELKGVEFQDLTVAIDEIVAGFEKKERTMSLDEKNIVAYHEAGHALISYIINGAKQPIKVSIIPRGEAALGFTMGASDDRKLSKRKEILAELCVLLGGRLAENLIFDEITTGASDDLEKVKRIINVFITTYAMNGLDMIFNNGDKLKDKIDIESQNLITSLESKVKSLLKIHKDDLSKIANYLLEHEMMTETDIENLLGNDIENSYSIDF